eukprot:6861944-Prymnesium_polylepis.1
MIWNTAVSSIAFVGMNPFREKLDNIFPANVRPGETETDDALSWADNQPALIFHADNDVIERATDQICDMVD